MTFMFFAGMLMRSQRQITDLGGRPLGDRSCKTESLFPLKFMSLKNRCKFVLHIAKRVDA